MEEGGCSFRDHEGCPCGGTPAFVPGRGRRGAFIGCSDWRSGDPLKRDGGHMSTALPHGVDEEKLCKWMDSGVEDDESGESCCFISSKRVKDRSCKRHGGLLPPLRRPAGGQCPVRVEVHTPIPLPTSGIIRVIVVLRGVHSHIFPVCKPGSDMVQKIVGDNPSLSIRSQQVCNLFISLLLVSRSFYAGDCSSTAADVGPLFPGKSCSLRPLHGRCGPWVGRKGG